MPLKLAIPNNIEVEEFILNFEPITFDIYYSQFDRDLNMDVLDCLRKYGSLSRSLVIRLIWAMGTTTNRDFYSFIEFINILNYNIEEFVETWGSEFADWFIPLLDKDFKK